MDTQAIQEEFMSSSELDASYYARLRLSVPIFAFGGMLPEAFRRLVFAVSDVVVLLLIIAIFV